MDDWLKRTMELDSETAKVSAAYVLLERYDREAAVADDFELSQGYGIVLRDLYNRLNGKNGLKAQWAEAVKEKENDKS